MSHTPGPWEAVRYESEVRDGGWNGFHIKQPESGLSDVAYVDDVDFGPQIAEANARLIAAAPDLLAACKRALNVMEAEAKYFGVYRAHTEIIRAAIILAEGK